jgi:hypothetical protein
MGGLQTTTTATNLLTGHFGCGSMSSKPLLMLTLAALLSTAIGGCVDGAAPQTGDDPTPPPPAASWMNPTMMTGANFTPTKIIDPMRAGGEPVIAITSKGTIIVSAHPGYTHFHPTPASVELLAPSQTQSYLWRSTDGGATFTHVSLLPVASPNSGPRGIGQGVSDPELTIDGNGRIWLTDLEALAMASVSWSDDDGATWLMGNNLGSQGPIDRQWLASHKDELYFTGNYLGQGRPIYATKDGIMFEKRGTVPCGADLVTNPTTGTIYVSCPGSSNNRMGIGYSTDGARTWKVMRSNFSYGIGIGSEPAIDAAGNVYLAGSNGTHVIATYTTDDGQTWAPTMDLTSYFPEFAEGGWVIWPWMSAGSEGRFAVTFLGAPGATAQSDVNAQWHAYSVLIVNATGETEVWPAKLTSTPLHKGAVCVGTFCQTGTATNPRNDRRLGDFFETTISPDGFLHVVYSNTQAHPSHAVSHVAFHKQISGPKLVEGTVPKGFPTQG